MNLKDAYLHGTDLGALVKNISWSNGKLVIKWALEGKADTTLDTPVSGANITLSTSALNFLTANNTTYTIQLPSTDPYQSDNDSRYLKLAGNSTSGPMTGTIYMNNVGGLYINSNNADLDIWHVVGNSGSWASQYGFNLQYNGTGSDNNNDLVLYAHNQSGSHVVSYRIHQDGQMVFTSAPKVGTATVMLDTHAANGITSTNISNWNSVYEWFSVAANNDGTGDAINKWKELEAFLTSITDDQTLSGLLAGRVAKSGDTMTGALTTPGLTVTGAATFSQAINGSILGNAATASRLQNARTISLGGHASGSATFDGSANITLSVSGIYATTAAVNNSDADSTYRLVWHSGNTLYSTSDVYVNPSTDVIYSKGLNVTGNIFGSTYRLGQNSVGSRSVLLLNAPANTQSDIIFRNGSYTNSTWGDWAISSRGNSGETNAGNSLVIGRGGQNEGASSENICFKIYHDTKIIIGPSIFSTAPSYLLHVVGDIYSSAYIRANSGFVKTSSSNDYVLLGGGGHKPISEFTTLSGEQTVTGNKTFSGSVSIDDLTVGNLVVTGGASFAQTINGNAATASKLATARTISLTGSVTGSGTFDGSGNLSIATTTNHTHDYLPLAGGTMTGAAPINFAPNTVQMNFRPGHDGYNAKLEYMTNGNEALVFATKASVTSFMFVNGLDLTNRSDYSAIGATNTNIIAMQIKSNKVTINKAIRGDSDSQTVALDVGGTVLAEKLGYSELTYKSDYRFIHDSASFIKLNSSTGTICIKLPLLFNSTNGLYDMPVIKLVIYEYNSQGASEIIIGGHNWDGSWYNCTYTVTGNYNKGVRLGRVTDGDKNYCILLGATDTTWSYVAVYVTDTFSQYSNDWIANWINACTISQITDESNIAGITDPSYGLGGKYLPLAGGTMTGLITTTTGSNHAGIKVGSTYINSINGELILLNNTSIRFGGDSWDYNVWAGLKYVHSSKVIYLGLADGSAFTANSAQSAGKIYTPGIDNIYIGNGTYTVYHSGNVNATTVPWSAEYLSLKTVTDNWNITYAENKLRFISCGQTAATGAPGGYYSGLSVMTAYVGFQLCTYGGNTPNLKFRKLLDNGTWHGWYDILHSGNYTDYVYNQSTSNARFVLKAGDTMTGALTVPSLSVTGASTFSQAINGSILGNAATASRLLNARTITLSGNASGSASFDGSGNITINTTVSAAASLNTVIAEDKLPARLRAYSLNTSTNRNTDSSNRENGFYWSNAGTMPANVGDIDIITVNANSSYGHLLGFKFSGNGTTGATYDGKDIYTRIFNNGSYLPWYVIYTSGNTGWNYTTSVITYEPHTHKFIATKSDNSWNSQFYSTNGYRDNVGISFRIGQTGCHVMVGLNSDPDSSSNYQSIDYCWYPAGDGVAYIYESGSHIGNYGSYSIGDEFSVVYSAKQIKYYWNGVLKRTVNRNIGSALYADASFYNSGYVYDVQYGFMTHNNTISGTDNTAANALLHSGLYRDDNAAGNTWIFADDLDLGRWGIYHDLANNNIDFYGNGIVQARVGMYNGGFYSRYNITTSSDVVADGDIRAKGNDFYIGSASGSQCHQLYDSTNKCLKFYFD